MRGSPRSLKRNNGEQRDTLLPIVRPDPCLRWCFDRVRERLDQGLSPEDIFARLVEPAKLIAVDSDELRLVIKTLVRATA